jgi:hypothetical protein
MTQSTQQGPADPPPYLGHRLSGQTIRDLSSNRLDPTGKGTLVDWDSDPRPKTGLDLRGADLSRLDCSDIELPKADLEGANLHGTVLTGANLFNANLRRSVLYRANLERASLVHAKLEGADLRRALLNAAIDFSNSTLHHPHYGSALLSGARWKDANLMDLNWGDIPDVGEEGVARGLEGVAGDEAKRRRINYYRQAAEAYLQLATAFREQGINEVADAFAIRSQELLRKHVLWQTGRYDHWFAATLSCCLANYGYSLARCFGWYAATLLGFAFIYYATTTPVPAQPEQAVSALADSVAIFHGRGFNSPRQFNGLIELVPASEAVLGLIIEAAVIATFAKRILAR